jgi:hypothetical protein
MRKLVDAALSDFAERGFERSQSTCLITIKDHDLWLR